MVLNVTSHVNPGVPSKWETCQLLDPRTQNAGSGNFVEASSLIRLKLGISAYFGNSADWSRNYTKGLQVIAHHRSAFASFGVANQYVMLIDSGVGLAAILHRIRNHGCNNRHSEIQSAEII